MKVIKCYRCAVFGLEWSDIWNKVVFITCALVFTFSVFWGVFLNRQLSAGHSLPGRLLWCLQSGGRWEEAAFRSALFSGFSFFGGSGLFFYDTGGSAAWWGEECMEVCKSLIEKWLWALTKQRHGQLTRPAARVLLVFIFGGQSEKLSLFQILIFHSYICPIMCHGQQSARPRPAHTLYKAC